MNTGTILTADTVIQDGRWRNGDLWLCSDPVVGVDSFVAAANDILAGKIVSFAACRRDPPGTGAPPIIEQIVSVGMGDGGDEDEGHSKVEPRFTGERNDPNGAGSHSLIPCYRGGQCTSASHIAVALAIHMTSLGRWTFRLPNALKPPHKCGWCGAMNQIVNQCRCDTYNLPTKVSCSPTSKPS